MITNEYGLIASAGFLDTELLAKQIAKTENALADWLSTESSTDSRLLSLLICKDSLSSCQIEGYYSTLESILTTLVSGELPESPDSVIINNIDALSNGCIEVNDRPLCTTIAEGICSKLSGQEMSVRKVPGTVIACAKTGRVVHSPPEGENNIRNMLSDWEKYLHSCDDHPLVILAKQHLVFESIHPFHDGNGRTGRIFNSLFLVDRAYVQSTALPMNTMILSSKSEYYRLLSSVRDTGNWQDWTRYMLQVTEAAALCASNFISEAEALIDQQVRKYMENNADECEGVVIGALSYGVATPTALNIDQDISLLQGHLLLRNLARAGLLIEKDGVFVNVSLLELLDKLITPQNTPLGDRIASTKTIRLAEIADKIF
jgi:hypothetical protein